MVKVDKQQFPKNIHFFMHMLTVSVVYVPGGGEVSVVQQKDSTGMCRA